jgi:hypothetical protein
VGDKPIFVLEHGLGSRELLDLTTEIHSQIVAAPPDDGHGLPWIVYAAELGYRYSGDEYWQTFEEETPGWLAHGDRYWIRRCFQRFHKQLGGAKPSGPWAEHFSIICWPITHAVLPIDLQRQLARILYELRHSFSADLFASPTKLGEFIAARSWNATSRFQKLAEEPQLVGQIATALLLQGESGTRGLLHPATLARISQDLDRERRARDWLRAAQKSAHERAHIRGLAFGRAATRPVARRDEARAEVAALGIEPRLVLRPSVPGGTQWGVSLEIPDLSSLLFRFPGTRETLTSSRCVVAGAAGRPLARARCLHGSQQVPLDRWPRPDEVLLKFERDDQQLDFLLRTECLLRPGPNWLFRIASDGLAYELRSLRVRAGERYLLVTTAAPISPGTNVHSVDIACTGASGVLIEVPNAIDSDLEDRLRRIGLSPAKSIEVWPAGLAAVTWDGEGHGEWLADERACLGIRSDHEITSLVVSMSDGLDLPLELTSINAGQTVFVELPQLPVGLHRVRVHTRDQSGTIEPLGDLDVMMRIREARPWAPAASPHGPLLVQVDPPNPTLEQLWEGHVDISITGPPGRHVRCRTSLFEADDRASLASIQLPPLSLPLDSDEWERHFEQHFRKKSQSQNAYDEARSCTLDFTAEELGAFTLRCQRELTVVRWALRRSGGDFSVRLIDDSGDGHAPTVSRYSYETPIAQERLENRQSHAVPASGGLYVAHRPDATASVIVPPAVRTLADLRCVPVIQNSHRSTESVLRLADGFRLWAHARLPGDLISTMRQKTVLHAIVSEIFRLIGGDAWTRAESSVVGTTRALSDLTRYVSQRREDAAFLSALEADWDGFTKADSKDRVRRLTALAQRWRLVPGAPSRLSGGTTAVGGAAGGDDAASVIECALRLASDPASLDLQDANLRMTISRLLDAPSLARAARLLVIVVDRAQASRTAPGEAYAGWSWR